MPPLPRHLILIGPRAAGKTSIGAALARRLDVHFTDLDDLVLADLNCRTVTEAWTTRGEPAFRAAEARALLIALARSPHIIALGGGAPTLPTVRDTLVRARADAAATIIYLLAPVPTLRDRLAADPRQDRPALTSRGTLDEIAHILAARDPVYRELADATIDTADRPIDALAEDLARLAAPMR